MCGRAIGDILYQRIAPNKIGQKDIGDQKGNDKEDKPFKAPFSYFFGIPRLSVQSHLGAPIPIYPIFDPPEHHLHKDGLGTDPSTENTTEGHSEQGDKNDPDNHTDHKNKEILRPKWKSKNIKTAFQNIK